MKGRRPRKCGVREIFKRRIQYGDGHNLLQELRFGDEEMFFIYTRMNIERFEYLLNLIGPMIKKRDMYTAIIPSQRLAMTLRYLAAGDSQRTLSFAYRCAQSTVSCILTETTKAIVRVLLPVFMKAPTSGEEWRNMASGFWHNWQFPHCIGAIDGKHIQIQAPQASQSVFFNYKKHFSVILLAVCDSDYNFTIVDIGAEGSQSDGGVFNDSELGKRLKENSLSIPPSSYLPDTEIYMPYFLIGKAAFPMRKYLMKPYAGRSSSHEEAVFNYRLSRARRVIENAFGILVARWRIFRQPIIASTENVISIVQSAICLHNFIRKTADKKLYNEYCPPEFVDFELPTGQIVEGEWHDIVAGEIGAIAEGSRFGARNASAQIFEQRNMLKNFVNST